jgi:nitrite reductase/ring-hydroxylating ferredoxin subunit
MASDENTSSGTEIVPNPVPSEDTPAHPVGGCAGSHAAYLEGRRGAFFMRAIPVPKIVPSAPLAAAPSLPTDELYAICGKRDINDRRGKSFPLLRNWDDGKARPWDVFIARFGKKYFAYENSCPHSGQRLDWEKANFYEPNYMKTLMCGKHGAQFEVETGLCISGPCKGESLKKVECLVDDEGDVCLYNVNLDIAGNEPEQVVDPEFDAVLENNGFKLQSTKREFSK